MGPDLIYDTLPEGCCGEGNLDVTATGHFVHCRDDCCSRAVTLQVFEDSTTDEIKAALDVLCIVNND